MKRCSHSQQTDFTKATIRKAKKMLDNGTDTKTVFAFIEDEYKEAAKQQLGFVDNVQYQKAIKSVVDYVK